MISRILAVVLAAGMSGGRGGGSVASVSSPSSPSCTVSPSSATSGTARTLACTSSGVGAGCLFDNSIGAVPGCSTAISPTVTTLYTAILLNSAGNSTATATATVTGGGGATNYGLATIGAYSGVVVGSDEPVVQKVTPTAGQTCTSITFYAAIGISAGQKYRLGAYADSAGVPTTVLAETAEITSAGDAAGWITKSLGSSFVASGAVIWIGGWADSSISSKYDDAAAGTMRYSAASPYSSGSLPTWPGGGGTVDAASSIYITCS